MARVIIARITGVICASRCSEHRMAFFFLFLFLLTTFCNGQQTLNSSCGVSSGTKYTLYQYATDAVGTKNYHLVTMMKGEDFPNSEILGSALIEADKDCNCLMEVNTVHKDVTSWFGFARNIDNMLITNDTVPESYNRTGSRFFCAREENACGASVALQSFYSQVNDDHSYATKNGTELEGRQQLEYIGVLCYIWPVSDGKDLPADYKPPAPAGLGEASTKATTKADIKPIAEAAQPTEKVISPAGSLLPTVFVQTSISGSGIRSSLRPVEMETTVTIQTGQPAISVEWDHSRNLSTMERAMLYVNWYSASIDFINSVSNGTPADYHQYMPYYPGPPIFDNGTTQPYPTTLQPQTVSPDHRNLTTKAVVSKSTPAPPLVPPSIPSNPVFGPWPVPALNFSSNTVLDQLTRMNLSLNELSVAYESWLHSASVWLAQYYGPEWILPNGTHIQKRSGATPAPSFSPNSQLDSERMYKAHSDWLNGTRLILANLLNDNHHFSSYLNSQPNKSIATDMLHHVANPPPAHMLNGWSAMKNSSSFNGNNTELMKAYEKWLNNVNNFTNFVTTDPNTNVPRHPDHSNNGSWNQSTRQPKNVDLGKLVKKAIPQLLAASNNGTDMNALLAAQQDWVQQQNEKTHGALAQYAKMKKNEHQ